MTKVKQVRIGRKLSSQDFQFPIDIWNAILASSDPDAALFRAGSASAKVTLEAGHGSLEIELRINGGDPEGSVLLRHGTLKGGPQDYAVRIVERPTNVGGTRRFWLCPECSRSCLTLFMPPTEERFACRTCYRLRYDSRRSGRSALEEFNLDLAILEYIESSAHSTGYKYGMFDAELLPLTAEDLTAKPVIDLVPRRPGRPRGKRQYSRRVPIEIAERTSDTAVYCMSCRAYCELDSPERVTCANGRERLTGACQTCGSPVSSFVKREMTLQEYFDQWSQQN